MSREHLPIDRYSGMALAGVLTLGVSLIDATVEQNKIDAEVNRRAPTINAQELVAARNAIGIFVQKECREIIVPEYRTVVLYARKVLEQEKANEKKVEEQLWQIRRDVNRNASQSPLYLASVGGILFLAGLFGAHKSSEQSNNENQPITPNK